MNDSRMCFTEPVAISCPACGAGVSEWCKKDGRARKWIEGAPVHLERIDAVNRSNDFVLASSKPFPMQQHAKEAVAAKMTRKACGNVMKYPNGR